jgi:bifunctional non-homologous end joining protein LigD
MTMRARANPMRSSSLGLRRLVALRREGPNSKARKSRHDMRITPPRWAARLGAIPRRSGFVAANMIAEQLTIRLPGAPARYDFRILSRSHRPPPAGFIQPCLPSPADSPPTGPDWVHEIKHDGYRLMARRDSVGIRLLTRNGHDWADRYPAIVEAVNRLKTRSCLIDVEAVACDENGLAVFERLRYQRDDRSVFLFAFDLLELNGQDLRREPLETRKATLASLLRGSLPGLRLNEHITHPGDAVFRHACKWALRALCRSGSDRSTDLAERKTG